MAGTHQILHPAVLALRSEYLDGSVSAVVSLVRDWVIR